MLVVGAGTIGGLYAAHLARVTEVFVLTRREEQARVLTQKGLRVSGRSDFKASLIATADPDELPECTLIILATKATQLDAAASRLAGRFPGATVMTVQNGLGAEGIVRRHGSWQLLSGVSYMSGVRRSDRHIEYELDAETWLGPSRDSEAPFELAEGVAALLGEAGLRARACENIQPAQWSKLIFNASVNTVAAITGLRHVLLFTQRDEPGDLGHLVFDLAEEAKRVAVALDVALHEDPWVMNVLAVERGKTEGAGYAHPPSMLEDVVAGRPTEIEFITGALIREAEVADVAVPLHRAMYRLVKAKEASFTARVTSAEPGPAVTKWKRALSWWLETYERSRD